MSQEINYHLSWVDADNQTHSKVLQTNDKRLLIGRGQNADLVVANPSVSRIHAELSWQNGQLVFKDLGSSYGSWMNEREVLADVPRLMYESGEIRLGSLSLWYEARPVISEQELLQTCFFTQSQEIEPQLTAELSEFKNKTLQKLSSFDGFNPLPAEFEKMFNRELRILSQNQEEQLKEQKVLNSISHLLNRTNTLPDLAKTALGLISKVMTADRGFMVLYNSQKKEFEMLAKRNFTDSDQLQFLYGYSYYSSTLVEKCRKQAKIILIDDAKHNTSLADMESIASSGTRSIVVIPLMQHEKVLGVIYLDSSTRPHCFEERHRTFLESFSAHTAIALHNVQLYQRAITDDLTQLYSRNYVDERLDQEIERAKRYRRPFSILLIDLDHFKKVNDSYGHSGGDLVLQQVSRILKKELRDSDIAGRIGGEEFIIILGETELDGATQFAERICEQVASHQFNKADQIIKVTTSIGLSCFDKENLNHPQAIFEAADQALYRAKNCGRNQVATAELVVG